LGAWARRRTLLPFTRAEANDADAAEKGDAAAVIDAASMSYY